MWYVWHCIFNPYGKYDLSVGCTTFVGIDEVDEMYKSLWLGYQYPKLAQ